MSSKLFDIATPKHQEPCPDYVGSFAHVSRGRTQVLARRASPARIPKPAPGTGNAPTTRVPDNKSSIEPWTIPLHIIMWTTLLCGLIMVLVIFLMHA